MLRTELEGALNNWLGVREAEGLRDTTLYNYRTHVGILLSWLGDKELAPLTFAAFFTNYRRGHSVASCQAVYNASSLFLRGIDRPELMGNMRRPKGDIAPRTTYSDGQLQALFRVLRVDRSATGLRDHAIICILRYCGLRASEACNLRLDDLLGQDEVVQIVDGKSRHARRVVPLVDPCSHTLAAYMAKARPKLVKGYSSNYLFLSAEGRPMTRNTLRMMLRRRGNDVGFPLSAHRFRHTWATAHVRTHTNPATIGQLAGWSPKTLMEMLSQYGHPDIEALREAQREAFSR